ncbi:hypothetical protein CQW23_12071 [Capsicum baccatum]|uniref:Glycosyltransferase N-terminal domain-containing protein n=1 Tax=Capsicum baccatum TaxID=33114 RepID=A0A2G2WRJ9_CAPBA|nr:hypothetical protein CQW23_12071 [Capsicum baccatum]
MYMDVLIASPQRNSSKLDLLIILPIMCFKVRFGLSATPFWSGLSGMVGSAMRNHQARIRANALNPSYIEKFHFHDLPAPEFASPPPDFNSLSKFPAHLQPSWDSKFPAHLQPSWDAYMLLHVPIASFLCDISSKAR